MQSINNIYEVLNDDNNIITLRKKTINIDDYTVSENANGDIILQKIARIDIYDKKCITNHDFKNSEISYCSIDGADVEKLKYNSILNTIYKKINDGTTIIKHSVLNIKTIKKEDNGFYYIEGLGISIQRVDANKCIYEIITQCIENKINILMKIKLQNCKICNLYF